MRDEVITDLNEERMLVSERLNENGKNRWHILLEKVVTEHNEIWLADQIKKENLLNTSERRRKKTGGYIQAKIPITAAEILANGEFNKYYIRAICLKAIQNQQTFVIVYRARGVENPRTKSTQKVGNQLNAESLLADLRAKKGDDSLFLLAQSNSGLSVKTELI